MSSGHRLRDVEQQRPLLDRDDAEASPPGEANRLWFIQDCCGMVCAVITWLLVFFADFVVTFVMLLPSRSFWYAVLNGVLFNSLAVLALASHLRTMLTDPVRRLSEFSERDGKTLHSDLMFVSPPSSRQGAVPKGNATKKFMESLQLKPGEVVYKCPKCCSIKPERAHHCRSGGFQPPEEGVRTILSCLVFLLPVSLLFGPRSSARFYVVYCERKKKVGCISAEICRT